MLPGAWWALVWGILGVLALVVSVIWRPRVRNRRGRRALILERWRDFFEESTKVVIDCDYESLMTEREMKSMITQFARSYNLHKKYCLAPDPGEQRVGVMFAGMRQDGQLTKLLRGAAGTDLWRAHILHETVPEVFAGKMDNLVYLTADSPNILECFDPESVYIIGGFVDKNRHKGASFEQAREWGVRTARLPVRETLGYVPGLKIV